MYARVLLGIVFVSAGISQTIATERKPEVNHSLLQNSYKPRSNQVRPLFTSHKRSRRNNLFQGLFQSNKPSGANYLTILKNGSSYSSKELRWRPPFTYEHPTHPELLKLRKNYKLDDVAGTGDEISKIKKLMNWAHKVIPYDGNRTVPLQRNAASIITTAQKNKCGFDCRGMATILNEAYLAMGFESRLLTCLPKDSSDREHHVITMVYSRSLDKWLWIDPSNNAYLTDEKGNLLSVQEIRERLIKEKNLALNKDANLNSKPITIKQYIYDYMTKNLFWFQTPLHSGFDTETPGPNKQINYVALFPTSYTPYGLKDLRVKDGTAYMTTNPDYFWQKPRTTTIAAPRQKKSKKR